MLKAVITGDLIRSSNISEEDYQFILSGVKKELSMRKKDGHISKFEIFRGDSFQCLSENITTSFRTLLLIKCSLRQLHPIDIVTITHYKSKDRNHKRIATDWVIDARMALGIGPVENPIKKLSTSRGTAFQLSGIALDQLKNKKQSIIIETPDQCKEELKVMSTLVDHIIQRTSALQCEVIYLKLLGYTETQIANELNVNQSAVNQRSTAAGWNAIEAAVNRFESLYGNI